MGLAFRRRTKLVKRCHFVVDGRQCIAPAGHKSDEHPTDRHYRGFRSDERYNSFIRWPRPDAYEIGIRQGERAARESIPGSYIAPWGGDCSVPQGTLVPWRGGECTWPEWRNRPDLDGWGGWPHWVECMNGQSWIDVMSEQVAR